MPWEIWSWYEHLSDWAAGDGQRPLLAAKVAVFVLDWHDRFVPNSEGAWRLLMTAEPDQRRAIENAGFRACALIAPDVVVRVAHPMSAGELHVALSESLGIPIDHRHDIHDGSSAAAADRVGELVRMSVDGDDADRLFLASAVVYGDGDVEKALDMLEQASRMGHQRAMLEAANVAGELGRKSVQVHWLNTAGAAGDARAMYNLGVIAADDGDLPTARHWFQRASSAGFMEAYAALVEVAERVGDEQAAATWAETGAHAGNPRCMWVHGRNVSMRGPDQVTAALEWFERGGALGDIDCMAAAERTCNFLGRTVQARYWHQQVTIAESQGSR
jgi:TPR repeat protein